MKKKNLYKYYSKKKRDWFEAFVDLHNHKFELVRTICGFLGVILQCIIMLKVFGKI